MNLTQDSVDHLRSHFEKKHNQIVYDAKAAIREAVRSEFCELFNVERTEHHDDEGGGSCSLTFPKGWTEDQATDFASMALDLDLSPRYGGPGRWFQNAGIGRMDDGRVTIGVRWGLDI